LPKTLIAVLKRSGRRAAMIVIGSVKRDREVRPNT
jgi:hypothetical protein